MIKFKDKVYKFINIFVFLSVVFCICMYLYYGKNLAESIIHLKVTIILGLIISFLILHMLKLARYYFILSETKISFMSFIGTYIYITFVNIILPFKLGEIYRFFAIGKKCNSYIISFLSILTERFYDTLIILLIFAISLLFYNVDISLVCIFLMIFVLVLYCIYKMYKETIYYINKYIILKTNKSMDVVILKFIHHLNTWYNYEVSIIKGKGVLIFLISIFSWIFEFVFLYFLSYMLGVFFDFNYLYNYIIGILSINKNVNNSLMVSYILISSLLFFIAGFILIYFNKNEKRT